MALKMSLETYGQTGPTDITVKLEMQKLHPEQGRKTLNEKIYKVLNSDVLSQEQQLIFSLLRVKESIDSYCTVLINLTY